MTYNKHIEVNPKKLAGKPVIRGTRVPVSLILNLLARGYSIERIIKAYPNLKKADVLAALHYSQARIDREFVGPLEATL